MNLKRQPEVDRATAQVKRMLREFDYIILVLVGNNVRQAITLLKAEIRDFESRGDMMGQGEKVVKIIEVGKDTEKEDDRENNNFGITMPTIEMPDFKLDF